MSREVWTVILAGASLDGALARRAGTRIKALAPVGGRPLIEAVWRSVAPWGPVVVVGPEALREWGLRRPGDLWIAPGGSGTENVLAALEHVPPDEPCLLCASDLPFATPAAVQAFLEACSEPGDLHYPLVSREAMRLAFPRYRRRFVPIREGRFTGGSLALVRPAPLVAARPTLERLFEARKNTVQMAAMLGLGFFLRRLLGTLTAADVEAQIARLAGLQCRAVLEAPPGLALDVDSLADYEYALAFSGAAG